jgi:hypothetical protein
VQEAFFEDLPYLVLYIFVVALLAVAGEGRRLVVLHWLRSSDHLRGHKTRKGIDEFFDVDVGDGGGHECPVEGPVGFLYFIDVEVDLHDFLGGHGLGLGLHTSKHPLQALLLGFTVLDGFLEGCFGGWLEGLLLEICASIFVAGPGD